ncbi:hypothetical protein SPRG_07822 [Saprolegnia parasitica CBS 223.65]|uniref:Fe2OG dioxygenase domain-containing protein n=1 Tax=Saprolegnia parasitica (strain CBS 223.65) TaxID=695850 RepID=A0A067CKL9_SAPPC|nr:hypothetical protein SPRG_07822 [Saprolegnia parasitica CBS 223.65]KDO27111.1 hypothetical protein SPRG_07822 [Saprolegnia parasitica CBS 223.65]|eukprot:XP_012202204.1 hypothetical protein SPRG_07822 [Saprolegnia parasitica CBS 223.65]
MDAATDSDAMLEAYEATLYAGKSADEVDAIKTRKKHATTIAVCQAMLLQETWLQDPSISEREIYLCYATALEGLHRRYEAIEVLSNAIDMYFAHDPSLLLALGRLQFKAGHYDDALQLCVAVTEIFANDPAACDVDTAADAYHLAGWVKIHGDDHTRAYKLWSDGSQAIPSCPVLARQHRKRQCWDDAAVHEELLPGLVGDGALPPFAVQGFEAAPTPAHAIFDANAQAGQLVFRSQSPLLTRSECDHVLALVHAHHETILGGVWGTVRHSSVKTTDVAVEDIPALRPWLRTLLATRVYPFLSTCFPMLADGSSMVDPMTQSSRCRVHDAFIVRYDAERDGSLSLPEHNDTSVTSVVITLNDTFVGGGTWFEALDQVVDAGVGHAVAFAGPLRHAGYAISKGTRMILVLFLYVNDFAYGTYLDNYAENAPRSTQTTPSGDAPGGFVVYNQTVELVNTLNQGTTMDLSA